MTKRLFCDADDPRLTGCRCIQCGYRFVPGDDVSYIDKSGDLIHTSCWDDYAAENVSEFLSPLT